MLHLKSGIKYLQILVLSLHSPFIQFKRSAIGIVPPTFMVNFLVLLNFSGNILIDGHF